MNSRNINLTRSLLSAAMGAVIILAVAVFAPKAESPPPSRIDIAASPSP